MMSARKRIAIAAIGVLAMMTIGARDSSAVQLILTGSNVIGGNGAWNNGAYDAGIYSALRVTDNQTGNINEAVAGNFWLGWQTALSQYFVLDLGATYPVFEIDLFNTHNQIAADRGTRNFHVDAANSVTFVNSTDDYDLVSPVQILSGTLTQRYPIGDPIAADVYTSANGLSTGTEYRYLRFTADNYYLSAGAGLNEIRVFVPEPSTAVLLVAGAMACQLTRRRRQH